MLKQLGSKSSLFIFLSHVSIGHQRSTNTMEVDEITIALTIAIMIVLAWVKFGGTEPDVHPLVLQEQSSTSYIRNEGESVIHRSRSVPHGVPLTKQPSDRIRTLYDVWQSGSGAHPSARSMMYQLQNQFAVVDVSRTFIGW
jgi:hypothetical protein